MKKNKLPKRLPQFLKPYFWNVDFEKIDPGKASGYIINRLLDKGSLKAVNWVLENFSQDKIKETIKTRRDWQKKSIYFWANYFNLPENEIKCLKKPYLHQRQTFWPY